VNFADAFSEMPLVAILRGVRPDEVLDVATALYDEGIRIVEVPLNSPDPFVSIERLSAMTGRMVCGAGTVLNTEQVDSAVAAGSTIIVAPNTDPSVIRQSLVRGAALLSREVALQWISLYAVERAAQRRETSRAADVVGGWTCDRRCLSVSRAGLAGAAILGHRGGLAMCPDAVPLVSDLDGAVSVLLPKSCLAATDWVKSALVLRTHRLVDAWTVAAERSIPQAAVLPVLRIVNLEFFASLQGKD